MSQKNSPASPRATVMVFGVGSFAHSLAQTLKEAGADVSTYLTRNYGHYAPELAGPVYSREAFPNPCPLLARRRVNLVIPQSIDWAQAPWADEMTRSGVGLFSPTGEGMKIERERDYARKLCAEFKVPFPKARVAANR